MTKKEFEAWKAETAKSKNKWHIDLIHNKPADTLIFKGGERGHFIQIYNNKVILGTYKDAIPHIGDAFFHVTGEVVCENNENAWKRLLEKAGIPFLIDLFSA